MTFILKQEHHAINLHKQKQKRVREREKKAKLKNNLLINYSFPTLITCPIAQKTVGQGLPDSMAVIERISLLQLESQDAMTILAS